MIEHKLREITTNKKKNFIVLPKYYILGCRKRNTIFRLFRDRERGSNFNKLNILVLGYLKERERAQLKQILFLGYLREREKKSTFSK